MRLIKYFSLFHSGSGGNNYCKNLVKNLPQKYFYGENQE